MLNYYYAVDGWAALCGPFMASQHMTALHMFNSRGLRVLYAVSCRLKP